MNILDLIARAKDLYATLTDPTAGFLKKIRAFMDFWNYIQPIFGDKQPMLAGDDVPATATEALSNLEALGGEGVGAVEGDGRIMKALLALLMKFLPLLI